MDHNQVKKFHKLLAKECGVRFINSSALQRVLNALHRRLLSKAGLDLFSDVGEDLFKLRPMCLKNIILLPYAVGDSKIDTDYQVSVAVHEVAHALRIRRYVKKFRGTVAGWYTQYFTNDRSRALEETAAVGAEADLDYALGKPIRTINLADYLLSEDAMKLAERMHRSRIQQLIASNRGLAFSAASAAAIKIIKSL